MSFPACFNDQVEFDQWNKAKVNCGEPCTYCEDCTDDYKLKMTVEHRCFPKTIVESLEPRVCGTCGKSDKDVDFYASQRFYCKPCMLEAQRNYRHSRLGREVVSREQRKENSLQDVVTAIADGHQDAITIAKAIGKNKRYVRLMLNMLIERGQIYVAAKCRTGVKPTRLFAVVETRLAA